MRFSEAVNAAMQKLAEDPRTIFVGQSVEYDGAAIYASLDGVPMYRRREMPVIEDFQMGFCTGLALQGKLPVCLFPRFDFLLLATNQLVNHLDKLPIFGWEPKVIIRTVVGSKRPLNAGPQHTQDYTVAFQAMLLTIPVVQARCAEEVTAAYDFALDSPRSILVVERPE